MISRASSGDGGARDLGGCSSSGGRWERGLDHAVLKYKGVEDPVLDSRDWGTLIGNRVSAGSRQRLYVIRRLTSAERGRHVTRSFSAILPLSPSDGSKNLNSALISRENLFTNSINKA
jgi:hypothetical protein